jgi:hypothetical protein
MFFELRRRGTNTRPEGKKIATAKKAKKARVKN